MRVLIEVADAVGQWVIAQAHMVQTITGQTVTIKILEAGEEVKFSRSRVDAHEPRLKYKATGQLDALEALGQTTIMGIVYAHLLDHGPCTIREIRRAKPSLSDKSIQSIIFKLRHSDLVVGEVFV